MGAGRRAIGFSDVPAVAVLRQEDSRPLRLAGPGRLVHGIGQHHVPYRDEVWGELEEFRLVRIEGDLRVAGTVTGGGILIVGGDLICNAPWTWYGVAIVLGDITFDTPGPGVHVFGALLSGGTGGTQSVGAQATVFYSSQMIGRVNEFSRALRRGLPAFRPTAADLESPEST